MVERLGAMPLEVAATSALVYERLTDDSLTSPHKMTSMRINPLCSTTPSVPFTKSVLNSGDASGKEEAGTQMTVIYLSSEVLMTGKTF